MKTFAVRLAEGGTEETRLYCKGKFLVVTKALKNDWGYCVTHIQTGCFVSRHVKLKDAKATMLALDTADWDFTAESDLTPNQQLTLRNMARQTAREFSNNEVFVGERRV